MVSGFGVEVTGGGNISIRWSLEGDGGAVVTSESSDEVEDDDAERPGVEGIGGNGLDREGNILAGCCCRCC